MAEAKPRAPRRPAKPKALPRLTREQLATLAPVPEEEVNVPEWGGSIKVRGLTWATQQRLIRQAAEDGDFDEEMFNGLLFLHCIVEPELEPEDVEKLMNVSLSAGTKVAEAIERCNGEQEAEAAQARFPAQRAD